MLDIAFSLFDYFIRWTDKNEGNLDEYFEIYVKPAYETAEKVFSDFLDLLHNLKKKVWIDAPLEELISFLEDGRVKHLPLRRQLYAEVENRWGPDFDVNMLPRFEKGLIRLLIGNLSAFDLTADTHRHFEVMPEMMDEVGLFFGRAPTHLLPDEPHHTLKDLERFIIAVHQALLQKSMSPGDQASTRRSCRDQCVYYINDQLATIESAWSDVVTGYSEYKAMVARMPKKVKNLALKRRQSPEI
jgi:hypothetical protein